MAPPEDKTIGELATAAGELLIEVHGDPEVVPTGIAYDSRKIRDGDLFFSVPGGRVDGHDFAAAAVAAGASSLCVEQPLDLPVAQMVVTDTRRAMARIAARFLGDPASKLLLIGVTGTNGKTTTAFLAESILAAAGKHPGLIGTVATHVGAEHRPGVRTTPESLDLHMVFKEMVDAGCDSAVMEVTSHALVLDRVEGVYFESVAFTNLSQDHLDFHPTMDDYFAAKESLFVPERAARGAVNIDDPYGRRILETTTIPCLTFGIDRDADIRAEQIEYRPSGTEFILVTGGRLAPAERKIATPLVGEFNVSNCLAATALAVHAGLDLDAVEVGIASLPSVPGRFEAVDEGQPFTVVVDYAHTPHSLENVLRAARSLARDRRVLCVFGCGGDRDRGKRPLMGAAVAELSDVAIVTSDNPRSEPPLSIIDEILVGVREIRPEGPDAVLADRREAIGEALGRAMPGDVVVIAGKGHESGQEFADHTIPFDDRVVARDELIALGFGE